MAAVRREREKREFEIVEAGRDEASDEAVFEAKVRAFFFFLLFSFSTPTTFLFLYLATISLTHGGGGIKRRRAVAIAEDGRIALFCYCC